MTTAFCARGLREPQRRLWLGFLACCAVAVFATRAWFIGMYGASVPIVHEWEATGLDTLVPWQSGTYSAAALVEPHNGDHPTAATRLWEIAWFEINGEWDPKLVMLAKAGIYALAAAIFVHLLAGGLGRGRYLAAGATAALFAFPFSWHNLLWAIASQFDFFFLAAAFAWLAMMRRRPLLALGFAFAGIFTNAAGPVIALSFVPWLILGGLRRWWVPHWALVFVAAAITIAVYGVSLRTSAAEPYFGTLPQRIGTFFRLYGWPFSNGVAVLEDLPRLQRFVPPMLLEWPAGQGWLLRASELLQRQTVVVVAINAVFAGWMLLPTALLLREARAGRVRWTEAAGPLAMGCFTLAMLAATAFARAAQTTVTVRYLDQVIFAGFAGMAACVPLCTHQTRWRRFSTTWLGCLAVGYAASMVMTAVQLEERYFTKFEQTMRAYYATGDRGVLTRNDAYREHFYERTADHVFALVDAPELRPILPATLLRPDGRPRPVARLAFFFAAWSPLVVLAAAISAAWIARRAWRLQHPHDPVPSGAALAAP